MFYPESVSPELLQLLKDLMLETELEEFILGGGYFPVAAFRAPTIN